MAVTTFASNVAEHLARPQKRRSGRRQVLVVGRAMERVVQVARETGDLSDLPESAGSISSA